MEKALGGKVVSKYVENVPEGADAERVIRELAQSGNQLVFTTSFGYMNPTLKVAKAFPKTYFEHATGYKTDVNVGIYNARFYEGRYLAGHRRRQDDEVERRRLRRRVPDPRSRDGHQRVRARDEERQPEGGGQGHLGQLVVRPGPRARRRGDADLAGRRRAHAPHRLDRRRAGRRGEERLRGRLPLRHVEVRPEGAADRGHAPVGRVLHEGRAGRDGRQVEARQRLGRHQGRHDQDGAVQPGRAQGRRRTSSTRPRPTSAPASSTRSPAR